MQEHPNYIAGEWIGGDFRPNINPSDVSDIVGLYARSTSDEVERAIEAAALAAPAWGAMPAPGRATILDKAGSEILARVDELGKLLAREEGKTFSEAVGEVSRAGQTFRYYAQQIMQPTGERYPSSHSGVAIDVLRRPVGVVGVITPWNYPIAIPAWKIAPALAYGNSVVFKPADIVPASAWMLASILHGAGVPPGTFNMVMGSGRLIGQHIVESPLVDAITFTGSGEVGSHIAAESATHGMKRVQLEMGGKNPLLVLDDADLDIAVQAALNGSFYSTGQRCTASSRLVVEAGVHDEFVDRLAAVTAELVVGHALEPLTAVGPVVSEEQLQQDLDYIALGRQEGATVIAGGETITRSTNGHFLAPTLFADGKNDMSINREEIFGPVSCVLKVGDYEEGLMVANDTEFGLAAGIITTSLAKAHDFRHRAQAGILAVNRPTALTELHVPFGGVKGSSHGPREQGPDARDFFTSVSTAYIASSL